jgi:hypothetical protein
LNRKSRHVNKCAGEAAKLSQLRPKSGGKTAALQRTSRIVSRQVQFSLIKIVFLCGALAAARYP